MDRVYVLVIIILNNKYNSSNILVGTYSSCPALLNVPRPNARYWIVRFLNNYFYNIQTDCLRE